MEVDRAKLRDLLTGIQSGGAGAAAVYGSFLDRLPTMFGSAKLAGEADLILAALTAAEQAYADAVDAVAPVTFEPAGQDAEGNPFFRPSAFAPVGGLSSDWQGVPLYALACALGRARERQSVDDEIYSASFVYVLFRLKAALGVWRGDASPDARYRLWLKDMAPVIAAHPRLGLTVIACHDRIARAVLDECEIYLPALEGGSRSEPPPVFAAFALTASHHAARAGMTNELEKLLLEWTVRYAAFDVASQGANGRAVSLYSASLSSRTSELFWSVGQIHYLAADYMCRGRAKHDETGYGPGAALVDCEAAVALLIGLRESLELLGIWDVKLRADLARAYASRGTAKQDVGGFGAEGAILDYNEAIVQMECLRATQEPIVAWKSELRIDLAQTYIDRGDAKDDALDFGPNAAILDYDEGIMHLEALRTTLKPLEAWDPRLCHELARAYTNRGIAKSEAAGQDPGAAIFDYDEAITIREALLLILGPEHIWNHRIFAGLASSYINRGNAKNDVPDYGPEAAIADFDKAIATLLKLRAAAEPICAWDTSLRSDLAGSYMSRGNAKQKDTRHGPTAAIPDFDEAIVQMESLRATLEPVGAWTRKLSHHLTGFYINRGNAKQSEAVRDPGAAILDYDEAITLMKELCATPEPRGAWDPKLCNDLAGAYVNRGNAKQRAAGRGASAAILDYDEAIMLLKELQATLEPIGAWDPPLRNLLATAYISRGIAKRNAAGHGPGAAILDHDEAITLLKELRARLEPMGALDPSLRNKLARAYMHRGTAKESAAGHGLGPAILDYDEAITLRKELRATLEPRGAWDPPLRNDLAMAHYNRGHAKAETGDRAGACNDATAARDISEDLLEHVGPAAPPFWHRVAAAAAELVAASCGPEI